MKYVGIYQIWPWGITAGICHPFPLRGLALIHQSHYQCPWFTDHSLPIIHKGHLARSMSYQPDLLWTCLSKRRCKNRPFLNEHEKSLLKSLRAAYIKRYNKNAGHGLSWWACGDGKIFNHIRVMPWWPPQGLAPVPHMAEHTKWPLKISSVTVT